MCGHPDPDQLDADIGDAFSEFFGQIMENFESVARRFSLPPFCVKALHMLGSPMTMKELGRRFHCDPSFVTAIADLLDTRGLGQREPDARDRRIKHLRLTAKGLDLRDRVEREVLTRMPWTYGLNASERECLLVLLRKMINADQERRAEGSDPDSAAGRAGQAGNPAGSPAAAHDTPPATTGVHRAGEVTREITPATPGGH